MMSGTGTPLLPNSLRVVMNLAYRRTDADHIGNWNRGFAYFMFVSTLSKKKKKKKLFIFCFVICPDLCN
jgi:hypothetical protein